MRATSRDRAQRRRPWLRASQRRAQSRPPTTGAGCIGSPGDLTDHIADALFATDLQFRVVSWNAGAERMYGWSAAEAVGRRMPELVRTEFLYETQAVALAALRSTGAWRGEVVQHRRDGTPFPVLASIEIVPGAHDAPAHIVAVNRDLTDYKRIEAALHQSKQQLDLIYDTVTDTLFLLAIEPDQRYRFVSVNSAFLQATGLAREQVVGKYAHEVIPPPSHALVFAKYQEAIRERRPASWEEVSVYPAGTRTAIVTVTAAFDPDGRATHLVGAVHDISDFKQAEASLRESERRFRQLLEILPVGVGVVVDGTIVFVNSAGARLLGAESPRQLLGRASAQVIAPDAMEAAQARLRRMLAGEPGLYPVEEHYVRLDGTVLPVEVQVVPLVYQGQPALQIVAADISERRRAEAERADLMRREQAASQRLQVLVQAAAAFAGAGLELDAVLRSVAEFAGRQWRDLCAVRLADPATLAVQDAALALAGGATTSWKADTDEAAVVRLDPRSAQVLGSGSPLLLQSSAVDVVGALLPKDAALDMADAEASSAIVVPLQVHGRGVGVLTVARRRPAAPSYTADDLGLAQEIAQIAALAIEQARLYRAAQEATAVRDLFLSIAAHELKTPLSTIGGHTYLLKRSAARGAPLAERDLWAIESIAAQGDRLNQLINSLLDVSRIRHGKLSIVARPFDLGRLARTLVDELRLTLSQHTLYVEAPAVEVVGDELRLEQVLRNLIGNAVKYSPQGGPVFVQVSRHPAEVHVVVSDQGIGIPAADRAQLFRQFYRASNVTSLRITGLGIGLYIVSEIVALHGGSIDVHSVEGAGSSFTVRLPLAPPDAAAE